MADFRLQVPLDGTDLLVPTVVGGATFPLVLGVAQAAVFGPLRVTCRRGLLASLLGGASVCLAGCAASLAAANSSLWTESLRVSGERDNRTLSRVVRLTPLDLLVSTVSSAVIFRALGGRFSSVLPSSLVRPGAFARECLPSKGPEYATHGQKNLIQTLGRKYGCHSCGRRWLTQFVADHQPPSNTLKNSLTQQYFYPQCPKCSNVQGAFVGGNSSKVVRIHPFSLRLYHVFVPMPLVIAYYKSQLSEVGTPNSVGTEVQVDRMLQRDTGSPQVQTKNIATQTSDEDSEERGRRKKPANLRAILAESGLSNLMADFPVLIIWQQVMEFLNSFHPVDAFHLTLWGFAVVAAFGTI